MLYILVLLGFLNTGKAVPMYWPVGFSDLATCEETRATAKVPQSLLDSKGIVQYETECMTDEAYQAFGRAIGAGELDRPPA